MTDDQTSAPATRPVGRFEWEAKFRASDVAPASVKLLGFVLSTYADSRTGASIRPGVARLAVDLRASDRTIIRGLGTLEATGWVECIRRGSSYGRGGRGMSSEYRLTVPAAAPEQVTAVSPDTADEQVTPVSPDVDNSAPPEREQVTTVTRTGDSPDGTGDIWDGTGDTGVTPPPHETPPHHSSPHDPLPGWTVTSPGPVDNSAEMNDDDPPPMTKDQRARAEWDRLQAWAEANGYPLEDTA